MKSYQMLRRTFLVLLATFPISSAWAAVRTSGFIEHNLSVNLGYASTPTGYRYYFSTYDGVLGWSLYQSGYGWSGELRPDSANSSTYRADYDIWDSIYGYFPGYGSLTATMPSTDSNGDGLADFLDLNRNGNGSFSGSGYDYVPGVGLTSYTFNGTLTRSSGSYGGTYSVSTSTGNTASGTFYLGGYAGNVTYDTDARTMTVTGLSFAGSTTLSGTITYDVLDVNTVRINTFTYTENGVGMSIVGSITLTRSGNTYSGKGVITDGNLYTSWADYNLFHLKITDNNDTNGNGIPDLSDPPVAPPVITVDPVSQEVSVGASTSFSVTATGAGTMSYQWQKNGAAISGATSTTYSILTVSTGHAGN